MDAPSFFDTLAGVQSLLKQHGRLSERALRRQFPLDDATWADLKSELVEVMGAAREHQSGVLMWNGPPAAVPAAGPSPVATVPPRSTTTDAERRFLTVLFVDLVDSTPLSERLDPEQLAEVYRAWQDLCIDVIRAYGGHIAEYRGDGAFIYYGWPQAQEDAPQRAIRTGLGIVERLPTLNQRLMATHGVSLSMRIGVHSGLVLLSNLGGAYVREQFAVGETPNLAARVQSLAGPGEVLVSDAAHAIARADFQFDDLGERALKGLSRPVRVWRALQARGAHGRGRGRDGERESVSLVGRQAELAQLQDAWARARQGQGRVVLLTGEAGIGKSRLVGEHRRLSLAQGGQRVSLHCSPYHGATPLYPIAVHLERVLRFEKDDPPAARVERLAARLAEAGLDAAQTLPFIAPLIGLAPAAGDAEAVASPALPLAARELRTKMIDALVQWLLAAARRQPLLLVCEDLHWADPTTVQLLGQLVAQMHDVPMMAVLTSRPDFKPPWPQRAHVAQIALSRLSDEEAMRFAAGALHGRFLEANALTRIIERADGVPLFIEELVHTLAEQAGRSGAMACIPDTLQGSLMARLDRESEAREIAQIAAATGREFSYALLRAVVPVSEPELKKGLQRLVQAELLVRRRGPEGEVYRFRHALIRDAAYESTLKSRRAVYHQRIADALEQHFPALVQAQPELLARHLAEAGERDRAVELLRVAGERALNRCANEEALSHLDQALAMLALDPTAPIVPERARLGLRLEVARGAALMMLRGQSAPEVEQAYGQARALTRWTVAAPADGPAVAEPVEVLPALMGLWRFYVASGRMYDALEVAERMLAVAEPCGGAPLLGARMTAGMTLFHLWQLPRARALVLQGIEQYRHDPPDDHEIELFSLGQHPAVACAMCLSFIDMNLGDLAASRAWQDEAAAIARRLDSPFQTTSMLGWSALLAWQRGEDAVFRRHAEDCAGHAERHRFPMWASVMRVYRGLIQVRDGHHAAGLAQMAGGLGEIDRMRQGLSRLRCQLALVEGQLIACRPDEALDTLRQARQQLRVGAETWWEPELHRLRGQALALRDAPGDGAAAHEAWAEARAAAARLGLPFFAARVEATLAAQGEPACEAAMFIHDDRS